jgi:hypothetical protein
MAVLRAWLRMRSLIPTPAPSSATLFTPVARRVMDFDRFVELAA